MGALYSCFSLLGGVCHWCFCGYNMVSSFFFFLFFLLFLFFCEQGDASLFFFFFFFFLELPSFLSEKKKKYSSQASRGLVGVGVYIFFHVVQRKVLAPPPHVSASSFNSPLSTKDTQWIRDAAR